MGRGRGGIWGRRQSRWLRTADGFAVMSPVQLALRISSTSVTIIASAGSSTASTARAIGCFTFRATFFAGVGLRLALAAVRFAALATVRALPRVAVFPFGRFPRFCTFARFLLLAMIRPALVGGPQRMMSD
jgi:hypothetical protein